MKKCFMCSISEEDSFLYEGIGKEGVVRVCRKCLGKQEIPLVGKKDVNPDFQSRETVRQRLMNMSGVKRAPIEQIPKPKPEPQDVTLNKLVEKNAKKDLPEEPKSYEDLIDNFHWNIMRARRAMKLDQEKFAKELFEPLTVIEHMEKGILPKDYFTLIKKVEGYLGITLMKERRVDFSASAIVSEAKVPSGMTVSDLKQKHELVTKKKEDEIPAENLDLETVKEVVGTPVEEEPKKERRGLFGRRKKDKNDDISQEEIDYIIYRK